MKRMKRKIEEVPLKEIDLDTSQPRQVIEENKLNDLSDDIKEAGLLIPIILTPCYKKDKDTLVVGRAAFKHKGHRWFVLDGFRRILAVKRLKWTKIDAEIRIDLSELDVYEVQFRANSKRVQVTIKEMAKAIDRFKEVFKRTHPGKNVVHRLSKYFWEDTTTIYILNNRNAYMGQGLTL